MRFTLTIESNNAAMVDGDVYDGPAWATAALLEHAAASLRAGNSGGTLRDVNGNSVGSWELTTD